MIIGYINVDDEEKELSAQQRLITQSAENLGMRVNVFYNLSNINTLKNCPLNKGDVILAANISALGNSLNSIRENLQFFIENGISVYSVKEQFVFRPDQQTRNLLEGIELAVNIRNSMLSAITVKALAKARNSGKQLGQKKGAKLKKLLDGHESEIRSLLLKKVPKTEIARRLNVAYATLFNFLKEHQYILGETS